jgi:hypothetical protein
MILPATSRPKAYSEPATRTSSGPPNGHALDLHRRVRQQPERAEVTQQIAALLRDAADHATLARVELRQRAQQHLGERPVLVRDHVAMRASTWVAELRSQTRFYLGAEHMLELARLLVDRVPRHAEIVHQKAFAEAVTANQARALCLAPRGQDDTPPGMCYQAGDAQPAEHLARGGRRHGQLPGKPSHGDGLVTALEFEDRLQVLFDALRELVHRALGSSNRPP